MRPNPQETADLVTFAEEILNAKLNFLCSEEQQPMLLFAKFNELHSVSNYNKAPKPSI